MSPSDTDVLDNVPSNHLTLTTCNPRFSASTRLIVQAKLAHSQLFPNSGLPARTTAPRRPQEREPGRGLECRADQHAVLGLCSQSCSAAPSSTRARRFRRRRWLIYGGGVVGALVLLWFFFGAVSPLLPASY